MDRMSWEQFKNAVDRELTEQMLSHATPIHFIEVWQPDEYPGAVRVHVHEDGGLYIE